MKGGDDLGSAEAEVALQQKYNFFSPSFGPLEQQELGETKGGERLARDIW